jgi:hypothetical protein
MARLRRWGAALTRKIARAIIWIVFAAVLTFALWQANAASLIPGIGTPGVTSVDQRVLDRSRATDGGKLLAGQGLRPTDVISTYGLVTFLSAQSSNTGAASYGPYVIYSSSSNAAAKPDPNRKPDVVVDANGKSVALYQDYTNGRGATCLIVSSIDAMNKWWPDLQVYLWDKSLGDQYEITHEVLSQIPEGVSARCFTQPS